MVYWGTWVAQSVKRLTLDFGSGHGLMLREIEPRIGFCEDSAEPDWGVSLPLSPLPPLMHSLSLSLSLSLMRARSKIN